MKTHKRALDPFVTKCGRVILKKMIVARYSWDEVDCKLCIKKQLRAVLEGK